MPDYDRGDTARLSVSVKDQAAVLADPATLSITVRDPASTSVVYAYGVDAEVVRDGAGLFHADILLPIAGPWTYQWQSTGPTQVQGETIQVAPAPLDSPIPGPGPTTYTDADTLRIALGVSGEQFPDEQANPIILDAEDAIDGMLGAWPWANEITGRKIDESFVMPWQWAKLQRATTKMAVALHGQPDLLSAQRYDKIVGPDFERSGLRGSSLGSQITTLLDDSRLRRLTGRATQGAWGMRPDYQRFLAATRHDGT